MGPEVIIDHWSSYEGAFEVSPYKNKNGKMIKTKIEYDEETSHVYLLSFGESK